ncbi:galactose oxidase [Patellaria atrata CBS 101060]|uniref:Galactose oxidase n=1 Tax=Patellaria atrata CBS 101060 TaxID=1346257 RepID=A0A9P4VX50_9PEZI|nr:galactose oxidase [Patellaria atrata CBS 101060]
MESYLFEFSSAQFLLLQHNSSFTTQVTMADIAGALSAAENLVGGAAAFVKGIIHPTQPINATFTHITSAPVPRSYHSISIIKGRAYIFGGETKAGTLANNDMQIVILPSSGVLDADYQSIPARSSSGKDVPAARKNHTTAVVGDEIYLFGGEDTSGPLNEEGRVWVYHTISNSWSYLQPVGGQPYPSSRSSHTIAASDEPRAEGKTYHERFPQQPLDPAKAVPEPPRADTSGTLFIIGGKGTDGTIYNDTWGFDIRTRSWSALPITPSPSTDSSAVIAGSHLYLFGGHDGNSYLGPSIFSLDISGVIRTSNISLPPTPDTPGWPWQTVSFDPSAGPSPRSGASLVPVTTGQGREYLLLISGTGSSGPLADVWSYQLPSSGRSAALTKDKTREAIGRDTKMETWAEVQYLYVNAEGDAVKAKQGQVEVFEGRSGFASAKGTEVDGATAVVWGGVGGNESGQVLGDGWLITVDR